MAAPISCMRALPAGNARMENIEMIPYSTATTPAATASHSQFMASIQAPYEIFRRELKTSYARSLQPPGFKLAAKYTIRGTPQRSLELELRLQLSFDRRTLDPYVGRQSVAIGRIVFTGHQRLQVASAGGRNPEPILGDEFARDPLLDIGNVGQRNRFELPAIGLGGA